MHSKVIPEIYKIREHNGSFLATMPRPLGDEYIDQEFDGLKKLSVDILVSMLEPFEARELGLSGEPQAAKRAGIELLSFPIPDCETPKHFEPFKELVSFLVARLEAGRNVAIHCHGGIGRCTLVAAAILVSLGDDPSTVFQVISKARGVTVPDTEVQLSWFNRVSHEFKTGS